MVMYVTLELGSYIFPVKYSWSNSSVASSMFFIKYNSSGVLLGGFSSLIK